MINLYNTIIFLLIIGLIYSILCFVIYNHEFKTTKKSVLYYKMIYYKSPKDEQSIILQRINDLKNKIPVYSIYRNDWLYRLYFDLFTLLLIFVCRRINIHLGSKLIKNNE